MTKRPYVTKVGSENVLQIEASFSREIVPGGRQNCIVKVEAFREPI